MLDEAELEVHLDAANAATEHFGTFDPETLPPKGTPQGEGTPPAEC